MSAKLSIVLPAMAVLVAVSGCSGIFVPKEVHDLQISQLQEQIQALEGDNASLHATKAAYDQLIAEQKVGARTKEYYDQLAEMLKKALDGLAVDPGDVYVDQTTGGMVFATDLLFESGKFEITAKGKEVLKRFAAANKAVVLRLVGHTDKRPISKEDTKKLLPISDTNLELSAMRATAVMFELKKSGVAEKNMIIEGRGSTQPKSTDKASRRVEIFVVGK